MELGPKRPSRIIILYVNKLEKPFIFVVYLNPGAGFCIISILKNCELGPSGSTQPRFQLGLRKFFVNGFKRQEDTDRR